MTKFDAKFVSEIYKSPTLLSLALFVTQLIFSYIQALELRFIWSIIQPIIITLTIFEPDPHVECHLLSFNQVPVVFCNILSTNGE